MNKKKNKELENGSFEESIELRMMDLETQMTMLKTVFIRDTEKNIKTIKQSEHERKRLAQISNNQRVQRLITAEKLWHQ